MLYTKQKILNILDMLAKQIKENASHGWTKSIDKICDEVKIGLLKGDNQHGEVIIKDSI